jgi:hypothetical protein
MRKPIVAAAAVMFLLLVAAAGWYVFSPAWTVRGMVEAAEARDEARFSAYIDYPALRDDMKADLTARLEEEAAKGSGSQAKIAAAMGLALVGPIVDRMVSPEAMKQSFAQITKQDKAGQSGGDAGKKELPEIRRQGLNRFLVAGKDMPDSGLVFERRGLGWKVTGVELPPAGRNRTTK